MRLWNILGKKKYFLMLLLFSLWYLFINFITIESEVILLICQWRYEKKKREFYIRNSLREKHFALISFIIQNFQFKLLRLLLTVKLTFYLTYFFPGKFYFCYMSCKELYVILLFKSEEFYEKYIVLYLYEKEI